MFKKLNIFSILSTVKFYSMGLFPFDSYQYIWFLIGYSIIYMKTNIVKEQKHRVHLSMTLAKWPASPLVYP